MFASASGDGEDLMLSEALEDPSVQHTMEEVEGRDMLTALSEAIRELPEREQLVLSLYYYEELTVREVAEVMDLSPSRISQLLARSIMMLRGKLVYDMELSSDTRRIQRQPASAAAAPGILDGRMSPDARYRSYLRGR